MYQFLKYLSRKSFISEKNINKPSKKIRLQIFIRILTLAYLSFFLGCKEPKKTELQKEVRTTKDTMTTVLTTIKKISPASIKVRDYIHKNTIIAHRGSTYWAPEETEPAFRWARNMGADYLEFDIQMTKDSILVALHDDTLLRTSNIKEVYPSIEKPTTNDFTLKELRKLDFGSWFNKAFPERAKKDYINTKILTLQDVLMIAKGYRIKTKNGKPVKVKSKGFWKGHYKYEKDPMDNQNRPGLYIETKKLHLEKLLADELKTHHWLVTDNPEKVATYPGKVGIANTNARIILQTFYPESIQQLNIYLPNIPKCLLLWRPEMVGELRLKYIEAINFCVENNVEIMGPSIAGAPNNYDELTAPWMVDLVHQSGMIIHPYTFDTSNDFKKYAASVDGVFTNRADLALLHFQRIQKNNAKETLKRLGY